MRLFDDILNVLFPRVCCCCENGLTGNEEFICFSCRSQLPKANYKDLRDNELTERFYGKLSLDYGSAFLFFHKSGITQKLLHTLKYGDQPDIGVMAGKWFGHALANKIIDEKTDLIIPVPLHIKRERQRGYNQSYFIGEGISAVTKIPIITTALQRIHYEESQTHKSKEQRWMSVSDSFKVIDNKEIKNKRILLVDDVITTGATLAACGRKLLTEGAKGLGIAALAIAK